MNQTIADTIREMITGQIHARTAARRTGLTVENVYHLMGIVLRAGAVAS